MRGVDLDRFDFDYDLTFAVLFLGPDEQVYGRFGGRDARSPDDYLTLPGLRHAMQAALARHRGRVPAPPTDERPRRTVEQYAALQRVPAKTCIHCHQVYEFERGERQANGTWRKDDVWVYPPPEAVGLSVDPEQGNRVRAVRADSPAGRLGLQPGDVLTSLRELPVASFADVQYALHRAPAVGPIPLSWTRDGRAFAGRLDVAPGWRQSDLTWRPSVRHIAPSPCVQGEDLTPDEKKALGLSPQRLAFRQGQFVPDAARQAGIRRGDVIVGIDGKALDMTERAFGVYVRLNYRVGDRVVLNVLRDGRRLDVPLTLPDKVPF
jgi:serine protease Do